MEKVWWIYKYAPKTVDDLIASDSIKKQLKSFIDKDDMPHLLLYGPQGAGKSSTSIVLINNFIKHKADLFKINGSLFNGIDYLRDHVITFISTPPMFSKFKIVFYEEFDNISKATQYALRDPMNEYFDNARFIFTANYIDKIDPTIISRCFEIEYSEPSIDNIISLCIDILNKEGVVYDEKDVIRIVKLCYPDIRKTLITLQRNVTDDNKLVITYTPFNYNDVISLVRKTLNSKTYKELFANMKVLDKILKQNLSSIDFDDLVKMIYNTEDIELNIRVLFITMYGSFRYSGILAFMPALLKTWQAIHQIKKQMLPTKK